MSSHIASSRRVVALDELAAVAALGLGVKPCVVFASLGDERSQRIIGSEDVEVQPASLFSVPASEAIAAFAPDLIVGTGADSPVGRRASELSEIAPTSIIGIEDSWSRLVRALGEIFDAADVADAQHTAIKSELQAAQANIGQRRVRLSYLGFTSRLFTMSPHVPSSTLIADAGFVRPKAQRIGPDPRRERQSWAAPVEFDALGDHDADVIVIPDGPGADASAITSVPQHARLRGRTVHPIAQQWFGPTAFAFWVIARDLRLLSTGQYAQVATPDELTDLWEQFRGAVGLR